MRLIKPNHFAGRLRCDRLADLTGSQPIVGQPFNLNSGRGAVVLNLRSVVGLKDLLPGKIESTAIVAHVHHALAREPFAHFARDALIDAATVRDWCFTADTRAHAAEEPDLHRPVLR